MEEASDPTGICVTHGAPVEVRNCVFTEHAALAIIASKPQSEWTSWEAGIVAAHQELLIPHTP